MQHLSLFDLLQLSCVDKFFNHCAGNDLRWRQKCLQLNVTKRPNVELSETWKTVYAMSVIGDKKCQKCGVKTSRKLKDWDMSICRGCQAGFLLTKTQAKVMIIDRITSLEILHVD